MDQKAKQYPTKAAEQVQSDKGHTMYLRIKAVEAHDNGDGTYSLGIKARPTTEEERLVLNRLFPNTEGVVERALMREALIQALDASYF